MRRLLPLLLLAACAPQARIADAPSAPLEVELAGPQTEAFQRTRDAFVAEGLAIAIAESDAAVIASRPVAGRPVRSGGIGPFFGNTQVPYVTYRARVIGTGPSSRVILTASRWRQTANVPTAGGVTEEALPRTCGADPSCAEHWDRLGRVAARIRAPR